MAITVNLRYEYCQPLEDPETILLIDSWENQEAPGNRMAQNTIWTMII